MSDAVSRAEVIKLVSRLGRKVENYLVKNGPTSMSRPWKILGPRNIRDITEGLVKKINELPDAELSKEQEPKYPIHKQGKHGWFWYCPKCETLLNDMARPKHCSECGQGVKWI